MTHVQLDNSNLTGTISASIGNLSQLHALNLGYNDLEGPIPASICNLSQLRDLVLRYNRLPEAHNDMIFAVICARWGTLGGLAVIGLYMLLVASALLVAAVHKDPYARLVIVGVTAIIFSQVIVNIGMTIGLVPITGMTLPLVSYGGSSLLVNLAMVGLVLNIAARPAKIMTRPSFEFDAASSE